MAADREPMKQPKTFDGLGLFGGRLLVFDALPSTNQWLLDNVASCRHGDAVRAISQTAGRGRFQRAWIAPAGRALAVSVLLKPQTSDDPATAVVTQLAALAVRAALEKQGVHGLLKWPNDVMAGARKIAGILAERDSNTGAVVLGIGLNVNLTAGDLPQEQLLQPATSMLIEAERSFDIAAVCAALLAELQSLIALVTDKGVSAAADLWQPHDFLDGKQIEIQTPQGAVAGRYAGMDASGRLRLADEAGSEQVFWSGDVSVRAR